MFFYFSVQNTDPVGSKAPSSTNDRINLVSVSTELSYSLLCEAQAYPVPSFR